MIQKNKIRAVATIIPGFTLGIVAAYLSKSNPDSSLLFDFISLAGYIVYMWGCYHLLIGKGHSKWYMLLILIPLIPGVIIVLLLRDRNKHLNNSPTNKILNIIIAISVFACFWFSSIALLYGIMKIFVAPTMNKLALPPVREQVLPVTHVDGDEIYLLGLKIRHPVQGLIANVVSPIFENHKLNGVCVFLNNGNIHAGNMLIDRHADDMSSADPETTNYFNIIPKQKFFNYTILFNNSKYNLIDKMFNTNMSDFSWYNLFKDIRVVYILINKAIFYPHYSGKIGLFHVTTDCISGYLIKGEYGKDKNGNTKYISELWFSKNGYLFQITIIDKNNVDFSEFISNLCASSESEANSIISNYNPLTISKDIMLASKLSKKVAIEDLENTMALIEAHKKAGHKASNIDDLNKEILYLKSIPK